MLRNKRYREKEKKLLNFAGVSEHLLYREGPIRYRKTREIVLSQNTGSLLAFTLRKTVSSRIFFLMRRLRQLLSTF
jgi:hypothetical protein